MTLLMCVPVIGGDPGISALVSEGLRQSVFVVILDHVRDYCSDPQTKIVDMLVYRLRQKVENPARIEQEHGSGHRGHAEISPGGRPARARSWLE